MPGLFLFELPKKRYRFGIGVTDPATQAYSRSSSSSSSSSF